ncbi:ribosomal-protein-alanine N-acetyltransferase [Desulfacinum hydrothermale DSM 13146]|uniref:Ribosomal-protein-alanine N-acetyltransferase n=1 Tax=Desulfacinum hydrothermale DSM 13146 TaxID=1121390 RepID=A0A1W1WWX5_9BACT|nr:GNAT family N-acetyltransferase [Desulfacinum hydrothermale]SMC16246.1 ribosomal-protein-alanine N-acetyltransferase [Desulfacinum hydrothermale DSM 13146]
MIRHAMEADIDRMEEIETLSFPNPWTRYYLEHALRDFCLVYEEDRVQGYLAATCKEEDGKATILKVAVHPQARGRGVASALVQGALDRFRERGIRNVDLDVKIISSGAVRLYEKFGFRVQRMVTIDSGDTSFYIMKKDL